jgi:hypothetical protein
MENKLERDGVKRSVQRRVWPRVVRGEMQRC